MMMVACGGETSTARAPEGSIKDVVVVLKGSAEPLPFDPRGGRLTVVTQEIARLVGHPIVLELDTALSPELKASLEETVLGSFETIARELVRLQKDDPAMFAKARDIERVVCKYDAVAKESEGKIEGAGKILAVKSPPDRFPLLERGVLSEAVYFGYIGDLDARWGEADPAKLSASEQGAYFEYMMTTRPGAGYLWIFARSADAKRQREHDRARAGDEKKWDELRVEHVGRIVKLAGVVEHGTSLEKKVRHFLLEQAPFLGRFGADRDSRLADGINPEVIKRVVGSYETWLNQTTSTFDDDERLLLEKAVLERGSSMCGGGGACSPEAVFPRFDRFAFGMAIYDQWTKDGAKVELPQGPRGELYKRVLCPSKRRGEAETEIRYGCSYFFTLATREDRERARLAETINKRRDARLLELVLLNTDSRATSSAIDLLLAIDDEAMRRDGMRILFHDFARRDDVKRALEERAPAWWRDSATAQGARGRGFALLVMARQWEGLDRHYGDSQWSRFVAEFGGPIKADVLALFLSEGPRAVEMTPKMWPALEKSEARDDLVAKSLPVLFERDRAFRTSRSAAALRLLRTRLCEEKNAGGLEKMHAAIDRWVSDHPDDAATMSNARADFTIKRCAKKDDSAK